MSTPVDVRRLAAEWRRLNPRHVDGVVLVYDGAAYGWKDTLRDPGHECPGAYAVDALGAVYVATGGDAYNGAQRWQQVVDEHAPQLTAHAD